jgi:hypothetical protein
MRINFQLRYQFGLWIAIAVSMITLPVKAELSHFMEIKLSPGFQPEQGTVSGYTGGSYSLSAISNRDRDKNICTGFADREPDHILTLEKDFVQLKITVNSGGHDTTLLIQGPDDQTIRCDDSTKDARISDRTWKHGTYRVWVGTFNPNIRIKYTLTAQEQ